MFQIRKESQAIQAIPENNTGLTSEIIILKSGSIQDIKVHVDIQHGFIGDLTIELTAPNGQQLMLHDRAGGSNKNLQKTYSNEVLEKLIGTVANGKWVLCVKDHAPRDNGTLQSWWIEMQCSEKQHQSEILLPAAAKTNLDSVQDCRFSGRVTDLQVMVDIDHPNTNELKVELVAPSGNAVTLHHHSGNKKDLKHTYSGDSVAAMLGENTAGKWKLRMSDSSAAQQGKLRHWKVSLKFTPVDDLKKVEGIGPKIEQLLNDAGIYSFSRLSVTSPEMIKEVLTAAGDRFKIHDPESWPLQANMAATGQWEKLQEWQAEHDHGRMN